MKTTLALSTALIVYLLANAAFLIFIGFATGLAGQLSIDAGTPTDPHFAFAVNALLIAVFGLQHSLMARRSFKRWWLQFVPGAFERIGYVLGAAASLALVVWAWQPMPALLWRVGDPAVWWLVQGIALTSWGVVFAVSFMIDHFELFGLRQVYAHVTGVAIPAPQFRTPALYRFVRHPMQLSILIGLWITPAMSVGHLLLATGMTVYVLIGLLHEERDLVACFGTHYRAYAASTPKLIPNLWGREDSRGKQA